MKMKKIRIFAAMSIFGLFLMQHLVLATTEGTVTIIFSEDVKKPEVTSPEPPETSSTKQKGNSSTSSTKSSSTNTSTSGSKTESSRKGLPDTDKKSGSKPTKTTTSRSTIANLGEKVGEIASLIGCGILLFVFFVLLKKRKKQNDEFSEG